MSEYQTQTLAICMQLGLNGGNVFQGKLMDKSMPALLVGDPGVGKTEIVEHISTKIAEAHGLTYPVETYAAPQLAPENLGGIPVPNRELRMAELLPLGAGKKLIEQGNGCLFLDEISSAPAAVGAACLTTIQSRRLGEATLPGPVALVAAMNPVEIAAAGRPLTAPESNRFCWIKWEMKPLEWADWLDGGSGAAKAVPILPENWEADNWERARYFVSSYIKSNPGALMGCPEPHDAAKPWQSPRSWFNATRLAAASLSLGKDFMSGLCRELMSGVLGDKAATDFLMFVKTQDLPDPEEVLNNDDIVNSVDMTKELLPGRPDVLRVVLDSVVEVASVKTANYNDRALRCCKIAANVFEYKQDAAIAAISRCVRTFPREIYNQVFDMQALAPITKILVQASKNG